MECWTEKDDYTAGHAGVGCPGPETTDAGFTWIDSPFGIHIGDYKDTKLDVAKTLQVESFRKLPTMSVRPGPGKAGGVERS